MTTQVQELKLGDYVTRSGDGSLLYTVTNIVKQSSGYVYIGAILINTVDKPFKKSITELTFVPDENAKFAYCCKRFVDTTHYEVDNCKHCGQLIHVDIPTCLTSHMNFCGKDDQTFNDEILLEKVILKYFTGKKLNKEFSEKKPSPVLARAKREEPLKPQKIRKEKILLKSIVSEKQQRDKLDLSHVAWLKDNISKYGLKNNPDVFELDDGTYKIFNGLHRLAALKELDIEEVEVNIYPDPSDEIEEEVIAYNANEDQKSFKYSERARILGTTYSIAKMKKGDEYSVNDFIKEYKVKGTHNVINEYIELSKLDPSVLPLVDEGDHKPLAKRSAVLLNTLDYEDQIFWANYFYEKKTPFKEVSRFVKIFPELTTKERNELEQHKSWETFSHVLKFEEYQEKLDSLSDKVVERIKPRFEVRRKGKLRIRDVYSKKKDFDTIDRILNDELKKEKKENQPSFQYKCKTCGVDCKYSNDDWKPYCHGDFMKNEVITGLEELLPSINGYLPDFKFVYGNGNYGTNLNRFKNQLHNAIQKEFGDSIEYPNNHPDYFLAKDYWAKILPEIKAYVETKPPTEKTYTGSESNVTEELRKDGTLRKVEEIKAQIDEKKKLLGNNLGKREKDQYNKISILFKKIETNKVAEDYKAINTNLYDARDFILEFLSQVDKSCTYGEFTPKSFVEDQNCSKTFCDTHNKPHSRQEREHHWKRIEGIEDKIQPVREEDKEKIKSKSLVAGIPEKKEEQPSVHPDIVKNVEKLNKIYARMTEIRKTMKPSESSSITPELRKKEDELEQLLATLTTSEEDEKYITENLSSAIYYNSALEELRKSKDTRVQVDLTQDIETKQTICNQFFPCTNCFKQVICTEDYQHEDNHSNYCLFCNLKVISSQGKEQSIRFHREEDTILISANQSIIIDPIQLEQLWVLMNREMTKEEMN